MTEALDLAKELHDNPEGFDAKAHLQGASHARETVTIYTDAEAGWRIAQLEDLIAKAKARAERANEDDTGITGSPEYDEAMAEVADLEEQMEKAVEKALASKMVFTVRGVPFKQLELIDKQGRRRVRPPARKNYPQGEDGEEEYDLEVLERNIERNNWVNYEMIAKSIVKVVDAQGREDTSAWTWEHVENLRANVYESEFWRIKQTVETVTNAQRLFSGVIERDPDFLSGR